jgi:hypothetical protein
MLQDEEMFHRLIAIVSSVLLALVAGCARTPGGAAGLPPRQIILQMTTESPLLPDRFYFLALDFSNDESRGPIPVFGPPWGNGWGSGSITHYVRIRGNQAEVYRILPGTNLLQSEFLGRPFDFRLPIGGNTVTVTLDLETLAPRTSGISQVNVNYITTDRVDVDPRFTGPKLLDAFGVDGTRYLPIPIRTSRVFTNLDFTTPVEPRGDVLLVPDRLPAASSDLDIVDWRIEVRLQ